MSYGYDLISCNDNYGNFDENYYMEMSKPPMKTESFDNVINTLMTGDDEEKQQLLQKQCIQSKNINNYLNMQNNYLKQLIEKKNNEISVMNNQLYLLYILLFISIILIISQKISYANLQQLYEILRLSKPDPNAPVPIERRF